MKKNQINHSYIINDAMKFNLFKLVMELVLKIRETVTRKNLLSLMRFIRLT